MTHTPIETLVEYDALILRELMAGYHAADRCEPEPCQRSRSYWHGWRLRMMILGKLRPSREDLELTKHLRVRRLARTL